jgi:predicted esterase
MPLPLSQLIYSRFQESASSRRVITLHGYNQFLDATKEFGLALNPDGVVLGLQASKGVYLGRTIVGYTWFVGPLDQPSPVHFGDGMQEIERFLWDEVDRQAPAEAALPFLVGDEQGAIMALAMAAAVPDLLSGVVVINASFPLVPGWDPPLVPLNELPILLVNPQAPPKARSSAAPRHEVLYGDALQAVLTEWGATVNIEDDKSGAVPTDRIKEWIARQPVRFRGSGGS